MSTSAAQLIQILTKNKLRVFSTTDLLTLTQTSSSALSHALERLARENLLIKLKRGLWANQMSTPVHPYEVVGSLRAPWPAYLSLFSVLADAGVVEEIPHIIYGVSSGRTQMFRTPLGTFHFHHLPARLMWGYETKRIGDGHFLSAEPEKAFLDLAYLALIPRSPLRFPHKRGPRWSLDPIKLKTYARRFHFPPLIPSLRKREII